MSTIEEAREQARAALELIHKWRQREQAWDTPRALDFERIGVSIRALLDATEPPRAAVCEWCPASARGTAWHNDGRLHLSCGQIDHGQGWVPDEPAAILATDLATEPQETTSPAAEAQLEAVTSAIEKVLDGQDALHCTRVWEAWGYGTMSEEDFSPIANDAEAVHEIASAVLEALDATEPPALRTCGPCDRGQHGVCDGPNEFWGDCTCIHGTKPAEDEREALAKTLYLWDTDEDLSRQSWDDLLDTQQDVWRSGADAILAAGYSKGPRPITDEMVEAAAREYHERGNGEGSFARMSGHVRTSLLFRMKCALEAAEEARR